MSTMEKILRKIRNAGLVLYVDPHYFNFSELMKKAHKIDGLVISTKVPPRDGKYAYVNSLGVLIIRGVDLNAIL